MTTDKKLQELWAKRVDEQENAYDIILDPDNRINYNHNNTSTIKVINPSKYEVK